ncbi:MAG: NAD-dependent protein deacetylase [Kofleriaceae bacterium]
MTVVDDLRRACAAGGVVVLTGAGVSTESGIPDYRGTGRAPRAQIQHAEFLGDASARARYWARSAVGYPRLAEARPNRGHLALARLRRAGVVDVLMTQNVDGLHQAAGVDDAIELHGSLHRVECLGCGRAETRAEVQARLLAANPQLAHQPDRALPDGDAALAPELSPASRCRRAACGGVLKPAVVFFGGNVAAPLVARCREAVADARLLLVVGSSLTVFSGYRFALHARDHGVPVAILNRGPTRADPMATVRVDAGAGDVLDALAGALA